MTQHTTSLEVAKQLTAVCREKGIEMPDSAYYWNKKTKKLTRRKHRYEYYHYLNEGSSETEGRRSIENNKAYTLGELMRTSSDETVVGCTKHKDDISFRCANFSVSEEIFISESPEDAIALQIIKGIKSGEITSL